MVLGAVWCPLDKTKEVAIRLREIKKKHGMPAPFEVKWTKVSPAKKDFYLDLINYFFDDDDLCFRGLIVPDKTKLRHDAFAGQDHDTWYYKMYFDMLKVIFRPDARYRIYMDIKDTRGAEKVAKLHVVSVKRHEDRIHIWLEEEDYVVVLADRGSFLLPWTAFLVTSEHNRKKLRNEYERHWGKKTQNG
jgi:hypothetical protein